MWSSWWSFKMDVSEWLKVIPANAALIYVVWASMNGRFYWKREVDDLKLQLKEEKEQSAQWQARWERVANLAERSTSIAEKVVER